MDRLADRGQSLGTAADARPRGGSLHPLVCLFLIGIVLPPEIVLNLGSVKLPIYRLVLVIAAIPATLRLIRQPSNPTPLISMLFLGFVVWTAVAFIVIHGTQIWQQVGLQTVETLIPFLMGKAYIRTQSDFEKLCRFLFILVLAILPIGLLEMLTGQNPIRDVVRAAFGQAPLLGIEKRMGLNRAFATFAHPIHFGVFCASAAGLVYCICTTVRELLVRFVFVALATFSALSSGGLMSLMIQFGLIAYGRMTAKVTRRWLIFGGMVVFCYVLVDLVSKSSPMSVFIRYMTMSSHNAFIRVLIWDFGIISVENNPLWGIGLNDWARPEWLTSSMDNFWLVIMVRSGLPALLFFAGAMVLIFWRLFRMKLDAGRDRCRRGWCFTMVGLIFAACTVHYWDELYAYFIFVLGAGVWMLAPVPEGEGEGGEEAPAPGNDRPVHALSAGSAKPRRYLLE